MNNHFEQNPLKRLSKLIEGVDTAMLTTVQQDGSLVSRPMVVQNIEFNGRLYFVSQKPSLKLSEINGDPHVNIVFMDSRSDRYISVSGFAKVVDNLFQVNASWCPAFDRWFPEGPQDPNLVMIVVNVTEAEYWDTPHATLTEKFTFFPSLTHIIYGRSRANQNLPMN